MTKIIEHERTDWKTQKLPIPNGGVFEFEERWHTLVLDSMPDSLKSLCGKVNAAEFLEVQPEYLLMAMYTPENLKFIERAGLDWNTALSAVDASGKATKHKQIGNKAMHQLVDFAKEFGFE